MSFALIRSSCLLIACAALPASAQNAKGVDVQSALNNPQVQAAIAACQADRSALCGGVVPGGGRIIKCLVAQQDKVSPACKTAIEGARDSLIAAGVLDPAQIKQ